MTRKEDFPLHLVALTESCTEYNETELRVCCMAKKARGQRAHVPKIILFSYWICVAGIVLMPFAKWLLTPGIKCKRLIYFTISESAEVQKKKVRRIFLGYNQDINLEVKVRTDCFQFLISTQLCFSYSKPGFNWPSNTEEDEELGTVSLSDNFLDNFFFLFFLKWRKEYIPRTQFHFLWLVWFDWQMSLKIFWAKIINPRKTNLKCN